MSAVGLTRSDVRGGALWFVLASLVCALVAGYTAVSLVQAVRRAVPVVVARRLVPPLARVSAGDLIMEDLPASALPAGAIRRPAAVVGAFTRMGLVPGEVVTAQAVGGDVSAATAFDARLAGMAHVSACRGSGASAGGTSAGGASTPPPPARPVASGVSSPSAACLDLVAVALPLDADQGYQLVHAGDRVDVAATYTVQSGTVSQVVATDVPVLYRIGGSSGGGGSGLAGQPAGPLGASSGWLVLGVPPAQALRLQLAQSTGRVAVFLRPLGAPPEPAALEREVVTTADLAGASASASPPAVAGQLP